MAGIAAEYGKELAGRLATASRRFRLPSAPGLAAVYRKELADHFASKRFIILLLLICLAGLSAVYAAGQTIRSEVSGSSRLDFAFLYLFTVSGGALPPFFSFIGFLGPLVGLALAFDSINDEQNRGTLSRLLSQPIYRDSVINGKFLAGLTTVAVMLFSIMVVTSGLGIRVLGVVPTDGEILRLLAFLVVSILYVAFWMALATVFSIFFRQTTTSALAGIAAWIFFTFFVPMIAGSLAAAFIRADELVDPRSVIEQSELRQMLSRISPNTLFLEATTAILVPSVRTLRQVMLLEEAIGMISSPLPLAQSLALIWPQVVGLLALTSICFAVAYWRFMTREVRSL